MPNRDLRSFGPAAAFSLVLFGFASFVPPAGSLATAPANGANARTLMRAAFGGDNRSERDQKVIPIATVEPNSNSTGSNGSISFTLTLNDPVSSGDYVNVRVSTVDLSGVEIENWVETLNYGDATDHKTFVRTHYVSAETTFKFQAATLSLTGTPSQTPVTSTHSVIVPL